VSHEPPALALRPLEGETLLDAAERAQAFADMVQESVALLDHNGVTLLLIDPRPR
jgi:hypothetical protein